MEFKLIISLLLLKIIFPILGYDINYMHDNIDINDCLIDLYSNPSQDKYNLSTSINYYIKTEVYRSPNIFLKLMLYNTSEFPIPGINIYECPNGNFSLSDCEIKSIYNYFDYKINLTKKAFYLTIEINKYTSKVSFSSKYLLFEFRPEYEIEYMTAKIDHMEDNYKSDYYYIVILIIFSIILLIITIILYYKKYRNFCISNSNNNSDPILDPNNQPYNNPQNLIPPLPTIQ